MTEHLDGTSQALRFVRRQAVRRRLVNAGFMVFVACMFALFFYKTDTNRIAHKVQDELRPPPAWAEIHALLAHWSHKTNSLEISLAIDKRKDCHRVVVNKTMSEVKDGVILQDNPITMFGTLSKQIKDMPVGRDTVFDHARPEGGLIPPGHYELIVIIYCEASGSSNLLEASVPARALIVVEKIPVRPIGKDTL